MKLSLTELQKGDPTEVACLIFEATELRTQLDSAIQAKEKDEANVMSLGKLIKATNLNLRKALDRSQTYAAKASTLETKKGKLQKEGQRSQI